MRRRSDGVLIGERLARETLPWTSAQIIDALEPLVTDARRARLRQVIDARLDSVAVVVDALHDPHNGAAVVRSCDAFGVLRVHAIERTEPVAVSSHIARGSQKWIEIVRHQSGAACVAALNASGHELIATHPDGELEPDDLARIPRVALLLGNEREGIAPELRDACRRAVRVPMRGFVESLNVSVTAAILLHAATRGRPGDFDEARRADLYARALFLSVPRAREAVEAMQQRTKA